MTPAAALQDCRPRREPYYQPAGQEIALFEAACARRCRCC